MTPALRPLPRQIAGIDVPQDEVSAATWRRAQRSLPTYLLLHSVRSYCWGATIGAGEGWAFDRQVLWTASLLHDRGLTTIPTNDDCFEVAGGMEARRWLERIGLAPEKAERVDRAIVLHMQPSVTLDDGVESVLLDRATGLDVRGAGFELVDAVRADVVREYPTRRLRPPLPRGHPSRGRRPPDLPERPTAQCHRARRMDGDIAMEDRSMSRRVGPE